MNLRVWASKLDAESRGRLEKLAKLPFLAGPIAVMPDVHAAEDVCVGTVLATSEVILPTAVGQDLGCGMLTGKLLLQAGSFSRDDLERIVVAIHERVPVGRRTHRQPQALEKSVELSTRALEHQRAWLGARHLGTLGGGNHFIELQRDGGDQLCLTVHSGSRGIGAAIAAHHGRVAEARCGRGALPHLPLGSPEAHAFESDLGWALDFAAQNRRRMAEAVCDVLSRHCGQHVAYEQRWDAPHNVISRETHDGAELVIHRKGAMPAASGTVGIIPGSMGTASYLVEGLGNAASYRSCSHGAGRKMPRGETHRRISVEQLRREMRGVVYLSSLEHALIEEAPSAYKDIKTVLGEQEDLVRPLTRLEPLAVVKGG